MSRDRVSRDRVSRDRVSHCRATLGRSSDHKAPDNRTSHDWFSHFRVSLITREHRLASLLWVDHLALKKDAKKLNQPDQLNIWPYPETAPV